MDKDQTAPPTLPPATAPEAQTQPEANPQPKSEAIERDPIKAMMQRIEALETELSYTRQQLAEAVLRAASTQRDMDELQQFMADHREFGTDFEKYKAVKDAAEKDAKRRELEAAKQKRDQERADRDAKSKVVRAERAARDVQLQKAACYRHNGFSALGLDVYSAKWSFFYETTDTTRSRIDYTPGIGNHIRLYPDKKIDYSKMTISGSILNGSDQVRNLGVAITFFDQHGSQVGQETVQISNARPDVPYPFTSKIDMALDGPFDTSSSYVLYADVVESEDASGPSTTSVNVPPAPGVSSGGGAGGGGNVGAGYGSGAGAGAPKPPEKK